MLTISEIFIVLNCVQRLQMKNHIFGSVPVDILPRPILLWSKIAPDHTVPRKPHNQ